MLVIIIVVHVHLPLKSPGGFQMHRVGRLVQCLLPAAHSPLQSQPRGRACGWCSSCSPCRACPFSPTSLALLPLLTIISNIRDLEATGAVGLACLEVDPELPGAGCEGDGALVGLAGLIGGNG